MNKIILCLISLQVAFVLSDSSDQPTNVVSKILNIFQNNITQMISNVVPEYVLKMEQDNALCVQHVSMILDGLQKMETWALKTVDAWGKIPSGIFYGNFFELGQYDECLSTKKPINNSETEINNLNLQYCLAQIHLQQVSTFTSSVSDERILPPENKNSLGLNIGICVPDSCPAETMSQLLNETLSALGVGAWGNVSADYCQTNEKREFKALDIFTIVFFSLIVLMMAASTIYDIVVTKTKKNKILWLTAFSVYTNGKKIFHCKKSTSNDVMDCLNGIRVLSIVWVVYGHTYISFVASPLVNFTYVVEWVGHLHSMLLLGATVSVDSFFVLSGLLVAYSSLKHLDKSEGKLNIFTMYFHRYIRLTSSLAVAVLLSSSLIRHFGNGPLWDAYLNIADKPCQQYWWSTFLYVQNYVNAQHMCLPHSWYLSVDMQLFVLSPIILYPLWRWRQKFVWVVPVLTSVSMGCVFTIYMVKKYKAQIMNEIVGTDSMVTTYYPTHTRMGAWLVGLLLGYILHNLRGKHVKIPKVYVGIGWFVAIGTIFAVVFGSYNLQQLDYNATTLETAFFESFSRVCWSISLSWIIFACVHGYGGPVNWFLSLPQWQPIARLSYSIYLVHLPIQLLMVASTRTQTNFSDFAAIHKFWGDFGITLTLSLFWTLAFESPVLALEKLTFGKSDAAKTASREDLFQNNFNQSEAARGAEYEAEPVNEQTK